MSDLMLRVKTALVLVPIIVFSCLYLPTKYLIVISLLVWAYSQYELITSFEYKPWLLLAIGIMPLMIGINYIILTTIVVSIICFVIIVRYQFKPTVKDPKILLFILTSCLLYSAFISSIEFVSLFGMNYFLSLWFMVSIVDASGYFFGKLFGRNKMIANVSPNKTWEGLAGALIMILIVIPCYYQRVDFLNILLSLLIVSCAVIGDLWFSYCKRVLNIKDYSQLLPGHGGILDRIDGFIFTLPTVYYFCKTFAKTLFVS